MATMESESNLSISSPKSYAGVARNSLISNKINVGVNLNQAAGKTYRFGKATMKDISGLDLHNKSAESALLPDVWKNEELININEKFNATVPISLFKSFKRFFSDRSLVLAITDLNCSLFKFPKSLFFQALTECNLGDSIYKIADHPNPRYLVVEFFSAEQRDRFKKNMVTLGNYALIVINPERQSFITGTIKNTYLNYSANDFAKMIQPFGSVINFQPVFVKDIPFKIYSNSFDFKVKLHSNVQADQIPTQVIDQESTLLLFIKGLKPQCFQCRERGHLAQNCPSLQCGVCGMINTSTHQCQGIKSTVSAKAKSSESTKNVLTVETPIVIMDSTTKPLDEALVKESSEISNNSSDFFPLHSEQSLPSNSDDIDTMDTLTPVFSPPLTQSVKRRADKPKKVKRGGKKFVPSLPADNDDSPVAVVERFSVGAIGSTSSTDTQSEFSDNDCMEVGGAAECSSLRTGNVSCDGQRDFLRKNNDSCVIQQNSLPYRSDHCDMQQNSSFLLIDPPDMQQPIIQCAVANLNNVVE